MSGRGSTAVPPAVLAAAAGAAQVVLARRARPTAASLLVAAPVAAAGLALAGDALLRFRRTRTTIDPMAPAKASTLVVAGANRVTRNPMYVGLAAVLVAHATARRSVAALLPVAGFVAAMTVGQIRAEEQVLAERFGEPYARYREAVPRWADARSVREAVRLVAAR